MKKLNYILLGILPQPSGEVPTVASVSVALTVTLTVTAAVPLAPVHCRFVCFVFCL